MQCTSLSHIAATTFFVNIDESVSVNVGQSGIYIIENHDNVFFHNWTKYEVDKESGLWWQLSWFSLFFQVASTTILFVDRDLYAVGSSMTLPTSFVLRRG